uniref:Uncharacterized protein n=1 Tax=Nelumbo nucifera TaxID=4432 RepID=A0A822XVC0_NELNU|nr:TPA_asm: hypothetical protein HUJ06_026951 [Nelumbo nucifera]DAD25574.1 TPA_asm: hypothetical protein HUJ06_027038 [Nelumbo nucifera]
MGASAHASVYRNHPRYPTSFYSKGEQPLNKKALRGLFAFIYYISPKVGSPESLTHKLPGLTMEKADGPRSHGNEEKSLFVGTEMRTASTPLSPPTHNLLERPIPSLELGASKQIKQEFQSESLYCAADLLIPFIAKNKVACFLSSHTGREGASLKAGWLGL